MKDGFAYHAYHCAQDVFYMSSTLIKLCNVTLATPGHTVNALIYQTMSMTDCQAQMKNIYA